MNRVLVVDDDLDVRETLAEALQEAGYVVGTAENGSDALAQLRAGQELPSLILLDLMMPTMDGWQFRDEQRRDAVLACIPVVAFSARDDIRSLDVAGCLRKPVTLAALLELAGRFCSPVADPEAPRPA